MLDTTYDIVQALPDSMFVTEAETSFLDGKLYAFNHGEYLIGERLAKLNTLYEKRTRGGRKAKRIRALENVQGRTPAEAAAFLAKAQELRSQ